MRRFTIKLAERIVADYGLPCSGRVLQPVLRAAQAAHDAAVAQMEEARDGPLHNKRRAMHTKFANSAHTMLATWYGLDAEGRKGLAWSAAFSSAFKKGGKSELSRWLSTGLRHVKQSKTNPYEADYREIEQRIEQMLISLYALVIETPILPAKTGPKRQLAGLEAAHAKFREAWPSICEKKWVPKYDRAETAEEVLAGRRIPAGVEGKLFLRFARQLDASYTAENCFSASGGRGEGTSKY